MHAALGLRRLFFFSSLGGGDTRRLSPRGDLKTSSMSCVDRQVQLAKLWTLGIPSTGRRAAHIQGTRIDCAICMIAFNCNFASVWDVPFIHKRLPWGEDAGRGAVKDRRKNA
eukprot:scaffold8905_cov14-Tisochrysis_lutea.AAC.1